MSYYNFYMYHFYNLNAWFQIAYELQKKTPISVIKDNPGKHLILNILWVCFIKCTYLKIKDPASQSLGGSVG